MSATSSAAPTRSGPTRETSREPRGVRGAGVFLSDAGGSLAELRRRARTADDLRSTRALLRRLDADTRLGAQALARQLRRRESRLVDDRRRQRRLFRLRAELFRAGDRLVAGVDEVGVGPLAGPVVAAAVILPRRVRLPGLNDSKQVPPAERERLAAAIRQQAVAYRVAEADVGEIDELNIYWAALLAMRRAVQGLELRPDRVLVDARTIPDLSLPQRALVHGDGRDGSIAAASILAKVYRDALMKRLDGRFPGYGLSQHMGYATAAHRRALARRGPSPIHRRSFAPCAPR